MADVYTNYQAPQRPAACVFLLQLGGPATLDAIEPFLANLFADVLPLPRWLRKPLAGFLARRRAPKVRPLYAQMGGGSPLLPNTIAQQQALGQALADLGVPAAVAIAMRYAPPRMAEALAYARSHCADVPWVALSLYPQYSFATSRSSLREMAEQLSPAERANTRFICAYPEDSQYLAAVADQIDAVLDAQPPQIRAQTHLVFSAHGLPLSLVREGDPYPQHIAKTVAGILALLKSPHNGHTISYQSKLGPTRWLEPSTQQTLTALPKQGITHVAVVPVAFTSEHIETLQELDVELAEEAEAAGIQTYLRVPAPGVHRHFIAALASQVTAAVQRPAGCCGLYPACEERSCSAP